MEFDFNIPIYLQVANDIKKDIARGVIAPGDRLPSNADLAVKYKINPNTVQRIYKELEMQQITYTKRGIGTFIMEDDNLITRLRGEMTEELLTQFLGGMKALGLSDEEIVDEIKSAIESEKKKGVKENAKV